MFLGDSSNNVFFPFQSVICSQPRPGGAELPPAAASETAEGSNGVEAMEQQPPENSSE